MVEKTVAENRMGTQSVGKLLFKMALPMMASMLVQSLYNIVDSMYVSMINENALTAVSIAFPIQNLLVAIGTGTGVGINALLSKFLGEKNPALANKVAANGILLGLLSGVLMAILGIFIASPFIGAQSMGVTEIYEYGTTYLGIVCTFSIFLFMELTFERLLNSTGRTSYTMISQMVGAITNIILDPIMIFGYFFFPEMGVAGAAVATVTGQGVAAVIALVLNLKKNKEISLSMRGFRPDIKLIKNIYKIGVPSIIMVSVSSVMTFGMNLILTGFSSTAIAVFGVFFKMNSLIFFPVFGINNALVPIVAYNYGSRQKARIKRCVLLATIAGVAIMGVGTLLFWVIPDTLLLLFNASEDMLSIGTVAFNIISISFMPAGYSIVMGSSLQALGDAFLSMINSLTRQLIVLLPSAYLLANFVGLDAVWWAMPIAEVVSFALMTVFFRHVYRKKIAPLPG